MSESQPEQVLEPPDEYAFGLEPPAGLEEMGDQLQKARGIPREFNRKTVARAFHDAFELIGGVPRLAVWAHQNETEFYKLYARLMPNAASQDFDLGSQKTRVVHSIPRSALDGDISEAEFEDAPRSNDTNPVGIRSGSVRTDSEGERSDEPSNEAGDANERL